MATIHNRLPVVLEPEDWPVWLGEEPGDAVTLMRPARADALRAWPVSRAVNSFKNNEPDLLDPRDDPQAPPPSDAPAGSNPV